MKFSPKYIRAFTVTEDTEVNVAVLSGKGGTGKTFVSVNLACVVKNSVYIDCDVEEPNGHLFLKPQNVTTEDVCVLLPEADLEKCTGCRKCVDFCMFNALAFVKNKPYKFKEVCHGCGGCKIVCDSRAIYEKAYPVGVIQKGKHKDVTVVSGIMNTGEESGVPIIKKLMDKLGNGVNVIDCPPGSACTVKESIEKADYCIIVAEPTIFGVHNFLMVYELVTLLGKPCGVIINKDDNSDNPMVQLCEKYNIPLLMKIGYREDVAKSNAEGCIASEKYSEVKEIFDGLYRKLLSEVRS